MEGVDFTAATTLSEDASADLRLLAAAAVMERLNVIEQETKLALTPAWQFRRRAELRHRIERCRSREQEVLLRLGGRAGTPSTP